MGGMPAEIAQRTGGHVYQVRYPASVDYVNGPGQGATDALAHLRAQATACPQEKFVLAGYSEGAMPDFAARGLYGEYTLTFPVVNGNTALDLGKIDDVYLRFDYLSAPGGM